jgi:hypothetical protein
MKVNKSKLVQIRQNATATQDTDGCNLLSLKRLSNERFTFPCPFCGEKYHFHGTRNGHRAPHCIGVDEDFSFQNSIGEVFNFKDGYFIETIP